MTTQQAAVRAVPDSQEDSTSSPAAGSAPSSGVTKRVRKMHDLSVLFPECPSIVNSVARYFPGFESPGPGVPKRRPIFIQELAFLEEFSYFVMSKDEFVIALTGPTGCGKDERVLDFYARLNTPVFQKTAHGEFKTYEAIGCNTAANGTIYFQPAALYKAMKYGYPILIDEAFRIPATVTSKFHTIRDRGELIVDETGETLRAKEGFKLILTANQTGYGDRTGLHPGDADQDVAWLNGMSSIECDYPAPEIETQIVQKTLENAHPAFATEPALAAFAPKMVAVAQRIRSQYIGNESNTSTDERIEVAVSTRTLIKWANAFVAFRTSSSPVHPLYRALDYVSMRKGCPSTRVAVDGFLLAEFGIARTDKF